MASIRQLKENVKIITSNLFADCVALSMCQQGNQEKLDSLMKEVISLHTDAVSRVNHKRDKAMKDDKKYYHRYFNAFKVDFAKKANELSERIVNS